MRMGRVGLRQRQPRVLRMVGDVPVFLGLPCPSRSTVAVLFLVCGEWKRAEAHVNAWGAWLRISPSQVLYMPGIHDPKQTHEGV